MLEESWRSFQPELRELALITFYKNGVEKKFRLITNIQTTCWNLGLLLGIEHETLDSQQVQYRDKIEFCTRILGIWLNRGNNEPYEVTWNGLIKALYDNQQGGAANDLENALRYCYQ